MPNLVKESQEKHKEYLLEAAAKASPFRRLAPILREASDKHREFYPSGRCDVDRLLSARLHFESLLKDGKILKKDGVYSVA